MYLVHNAHLLTGLERRQPDKGTGRAPKGVSQGAVVTGARLALDGKVQLVEVIRVELDGLETGVCLGPSLLFFGLEFGRQAACAVFAGAAAFLGLAFSCC